METNSTEQRQNENWITVFRAGDYGDKDNWTEEKLDQVVKNYDPSVHEAPLVIGHPADNAPAHGWIAAVRRIGKYLEVLPKNVSDSFKKLWDERKFNKLSASFYPDLNGKGPYLRHLGALGALPPEVKGLPQAAFSDGAQSGKIMDISSDPFPRNNDMYFENAPAGAVNSKNNLEADMNNQGNSNENAFPTSVDLKKETDPYIRAAMESRRRALQAEGLYELMKDTLGGSGISKEYFMEHPEHWEDFKKSYEADLEAAKPKDPGEVISTAMKSFSEGREMFDRNGISAGFVVITQLYYNKLAPYSAISEFGKYEKRRKKDKAEAVAFYEGKEADFKRRGVTKSAYLNSLYPGLSGVCFAELSRGSQTGGNLYDCYSDFFRGLNLKREHFTR